MPGLFCPKIFPKNSRVFFSLFFARKPPYCASQKVKRRKMVCFANFLPPLFFGKKTFQGLFVSFSFEVFFKSFLLVCLLFRKGLSLLQTLFLSKTNFSDFFSFFDLFPKFSPPLNFF